MIVAYTADVLGSHVSIARFSASFAKVVTDHEVEVIAGILAHHHRLLQQAGSQAAARNKVVRNFLRALRLRKQARSEVKELVVPMIPMDSATFHMWLSPAPRKELLRSINRSARTVKGLKKWPLKWMTVPGVITYERAAGRIRDERGGVLSEEIVKSVVKIDVLPTAVANSSDHYVVLQPGRQPRYMTVEEVCRAYHVPTGSPLRRALLDTRVLSPIQAVSSLGRAIHVGVARQIFTGLLARGLLGPGLKYGSAYSGIDTFAAGVDAVLDGAWTYVFASEKDPTSRRALGCAWLARGLDPGSVYEDALGVDARYAPAVDLYVMTPDCGAHSPRNHERTSSKEHTSMANVWKGLEYVRLRRPAIVVCENVDMVGVVGPLTGMFGRLPGYKIETAMLDPRSVAGAPIVRERRFWVLVRD